LTQSSRHLDAGLDRTPEESWRVAMEIPASKTHHATEFEPPVDSRTAAAALGVHYKTLERMARKGEVPAAKLGRSWMFRLSVLSAWFNRKMHSNSEEKPTEQSKKEKAP
jgi:excisionase family DNA binding protein